MNGKLTKNTPRLHLYYSAD